MNPEDAVVAVRSLCEAIGHDAVMRIAAALWAEQNPVGALTVGPARRLPPGKNEFGAMPSTTDEGWRQIDSTKWRRANWQVELLEVVGVWLIKDWHVDKFFIDEDFDTASSAMAACDRKFNRTWN